MCVCWLRSRLARRCNISPDLKAHNVALRQRALKMGYTLNEYSLATLEGEKAGGAQTEVKKFIKSWGLISSPSRNCAKT